MRHLSLTKKLGHKLAKRMYGIFCAYIFLIFIVLIFMSMSRADTITVIEEVTTTETITEIFEQEVDVEVTEEIQVEQVTPDVQ